MNKYKLEHITDLANIADEDIESFCSELPRLIASLKDVKPIIDAAGVDFKDITPHIDWIADGEKSVTIEIK